MYGTGKGKMGRGYQFYSRQAKVGMRAKEEVQANKPRCTGGLRLVSLGAVYGVGDHTHQAWIGSGRGQKNRGRGLEFMRHSERENSIYFLLLCQSLM